MTKYPLISVIIPCFNYGRFIQETIDSVINQTYKNWEIIIVDDGSTDELTLNLLHKLNDEKFIRVKFIENGGPSKARNIGIKEAKGDIILPLDADDMIHQDYMSSAMELFKNKEDLGIVYCRASFFGKRSGEWKLPKYKFPNILLGNCIFVTSFFYKKDWELVGGFNETFLDEWEDYDFWLKLIALGRSVYQIDKILFYYRKGHESRAIKKEKELIPLYEKIYLNNKDLYEQNVGFILKTYLELREEKFKLSSYFNKFFKFLKFTLK